MRCRQEISDLYGRVEAKEAYKYCFNRDSKKYKRIIKEISDLNNKIYMLYTRKVVTSYGIAGNKNESNC